MPRDLSPLQSRPTASLQMKFDRLCSNQLVADAIEAFAILAELQRRELIALASNSNKEEPHGAAG